MISIDELINEISFLKISSEQLSYMLSQSGSDLNNNTNYISNLVRGSHSGQDAVVSLNVASKSLLDAAASSKSLGRICDECVAQLSK